MPKNEFGYARTRPGLFDHTSVNMAMENANLVMKEIIIILVKFYESIIKN